MAKGYYEKLYETLVSNSDKAAKAAYKQTSSGKQGSLQTKIDNLSTRMGAAGVDTSKAKDSRNAVEKLLGLPENQKIALHWKVISYTASAVFLLLIA